MANVQPPDPAIAIAAAETAALALVVAAAAADALAATAELHTALTYIGFNDEAQRDRIANEAFINFTELSTIEEKDLERMCDSFAKRTARDGRITIPLRRRNLLTAMMHWAKDFLRCSEKPSLADIADKDAFMTALTIAMERAAIRKNDAKNAETLSAKSSPGALKPTIEWTTWNEGLEHHLSSIPGYHGVPLVYVIREKEEPVPDGHLSFTTKTIACAALKGTAYEADDRTVHNIVTSFVKGELANAWIKPVKAQCSGREDIKALRAHFNGRGNETRRLGEANKLKKTLHYKNERAMPFDSFLSKCQEMFTIFEECKQPIYDKQKLDFLLERSQHPEMKVDVNSLEVQRELNGQMEYDFAANFLAGKAAKLSNPANGFGRNLSALKTTTGGQGPTSGCMMPDGSVFTGSYGDVQWRALSGPEKDKVNEARGKPPYKPRNRYSGGGSRDGRKVQSVEQIDKELTKKRKELKTFKRKISSMKREIGLNSPNKDDEEVEDKHDQAGLNFGGKEEMEKTGKKKIKWVKK